MKRIGLVMAANPATCLFLAGLMALCLSLAQWSRPLAGTVCGLVLMAVAVWPYLTVRKG